MYKNRKIHKTALFFLVAVLMLLLSACGGSNSNDSNNEEQPVTQGDEVQPTQATEATQTDRSAFGDG